MSFAEVERRVTAIPGVYECAARAVDHPEAGEALVLFIVPDQGTTIVMEEVRRHLPAHWALDSIRLVSELPKTSAGKIARSSLPGFRQGDSVQQFEEKIESLSCPCLLMASLPRKDRPACWKYLRSELDYACQRHEGYKNYVQHWPVDYRSASSVADLPFLPVGLLKANPPLSFVA